MLLPDFVGEEVAPHATRMRVRCGGGICGKSRTATARKEYHLVSFYERLKTLNCQLLTVNCGLPTTDCDLRLTL